ncbi:MAG TPA: alpha/beta fold hydrolase [Sandaracinaceae bacterium LLY-WYZ-13_1]|nr:alpha/beta fold hydrolase [Sandaracinaceae bacterium LLY-WYZ-13_1]
MAASSSIDVDYGALPQRTVDVDGVPVWTVDAGEGPAVLLVHGSPVSSFSFRRTIAALRHRFRVVAPDLPGFGRTPAPEEGASLGVLARTLRGLVDALALEGLRVVAHDWGGPVAMACLAERPAQLEQLVLVNTTFRPDFAPPWYWRAFTAPGLGDLLVVRANLFGRALPVLLPAAWDRRIRDAYAGPLRARSSRRTAIALERLAGYRPAMERVMRRLPQLRVPSLVLWGQPDVYFLPRERRWLARTLPDARTRLLPGAGHFPQEDGAEAFTAALEAFLV